VDGLPTLVVTHELQVERRTGKFRQSETDVLPLCYATNLFPVFSKNSPVMFRVIMLNCLHCNGDKRGSERYPPTSGGGSE